MQAPDQGHPVPRLPLQQPVVVEPLHELVLPLEGEAAADFVQPEGSKEVSWSQLRSIRDSANPGDTTRFPNEALQCRMLSTTHATGTTWDLPTAKTYVPTLHTISLF